MEQAVQEKSVQYRTSLYIFDVQHTVHGFKSENSVMQFNVYGFCFLL